jgi:hypothetical protein
MADRSVEGATSAHERWFLPLLIWLLPLVTIALGTRTWLPPLASEHGAGIDRMLRYLLVAVGSLYVIGNAVLGYFVWRFSRQGKVTMRAASNKAERRWSLIPIVVMLLVAEGGRVRSGFASLGQVLRRSSFGRDDRGSDG